MDGNDPKSKAKETKETPEGVKSNGGILYPNIEGNIYCWYTEFRGAFRQSLMQNCQGQFFNKQEACEVLFNSSWSNALYGASPTVQPNSIRCTFIIRFES